MIATGGTALVEREHRHRRWLLLGLGGLLVMSTMPVFWHHMVPPMGWWPALDHVGAVCVRAVELLLSPVHEGFHLIVVTGLAYAVVDRGRALWMQRTTLLGLHSWRPEAGGVVARAAKAAGLPVDRVRVSSLLPNPAFTAGLLRPRVFIAESLVRTLSFQQLVAVLAHERGHVVRRDPLRLSLLRFLACTLFWLPALRRVSDDLADEAEILADDSAAAMGLRFHLAGAILALAQWRVSRVPGVVGFAAGDLLDRRIRRLVGESAPVGTHVTWRSLAAAVAALALVWTSGVVMLHATALGAGTAATHCDHHETSPISHLFCLWSAEGTATHRCPHATT